MLVVYPMCCLKDMNGISKLSFIGTIANIIVVICIIVRLACFYCVFKRILISNCFWNLIPI